MTVRDTGRRRPPVRAPRSLAVLGAVLLGLIMASVPSPATAHGATMVPGSRTYLCYQDLLRNNHQLPSNPACADAVRETGTTPLYNWFAVLDSDAGGRTAGYIPDGELCSGGHNGPYDFSSYNAARGDWPKTHLTAGATVRIKHSNWAHHPGRFDVYVTEDGWHPGKRLAWSDLTRLQSVTDPPQSGSAGSQGGHYYWDLRLPRKSGQHILFIHWIRSDSRENFYSCSDVVFDGGSGQVTW